MRRAATILEVIGALALIVAGFLSAAWVGFALIGLSCVLFGLALDPPRNEG